MCRRRRTKVGVGADLDLHPDPAAMPSSRGYFVGSQARGRRPLDAKKPSVSRQVARQYIDMVGEAREAGVEGGMRRGGSCKLVGASGIASWWMQGIGQQKQPTSTKEPAEFSKTVRLGSQDSR